VDPVFSYDIYGVESSQINERGSVLAIGNFDGLHRGHMLLIKSVLRINQGKGMVALAVTFDYSRDTSYQRSHLMTQTEKIDALLSAGLEGVVVLPFTDYLRHLSPLCFVRDILRKELHMEHLVAGEDFRFGYRTMGDTDLLRELAVQESYGLEVIPRWNYRGRETSSTEIRRLLIAGDSMGAARILGRPYFISGEVVHGEHIGRTLGFPTANIDVDGTKLIPANGVYLAQASINRRGCLPSVVNIGFRPTFQGKRQSVEVHILNFNDEIYGSVLSIELGRMLRSEKNFGTKEELVKQINRDVENARQRFLKKEEHECSEGEDV
jgi:riboflavin kinase/FMN adenylyltransferase